MDMGWTMTTPDSLLRACWVGIAIIAIGACGGDGLDGSQTKRALGAVEATADPSAAGVAAGTFHTCALTSGGGVKCWGENAAGQLGDGTETNRLAPVDVVGLSSGAAAITAGGWHACALTTTGGVKCWGDNASGELGDGTTARRLTPVDVVGLSGGVVAISAGEHHTCALTSGGGVKCWGMNAYGQLGDGTMTQREVPTDVTGLSSGVAAIGAGGSHTCAALAAGGVKCWGLGLFGQVGDGTMVARRLLPVNVVGLSASVSAIAGGYAHTCVLTADEGIKCWGSNGGGQLGDGTETDRLAPVDVVGLSGGAAAIAVTAGWGHSCALTSEGGARCWGYNNEGQIGDGTKTNRLTPVGVSELSAGQTTIDSFGWGWHTCALTRGGGIKCWGRNWTGQLGDGTTTDRLTPVAVIGFTANVATNLENPAPGAHVSGIGLVSGWTCMSGVVEVSFDGGPRDNLVPSGGGRGDTLPVCGRTNTGFGLLFNYNLLGSGNHTVELFINGVQVGSPVPFTVTVPAGEFIKGASKTVDAFDFPTVGKTTRLEWQESTQNFAITGVR